MAGIAEKQSEKVSTGKSTFEKNMQTLEKHLLPFQQNAVRHIINGEHQMAASGETFDNLTPVDNSFICQVASGTAEDIDLAAKASHHAFKSWKDWTVKDRRDVLHKIADLIIANAEEIAVLESFDTGQPIRFMSKAAERGAENFRFFADRIIDAKNGASLPDKDHINYTLRQPIGPIGIITPWNTPFMLSTWKIAPALAAGCTIVHKPAELSPLTANRLAEIALEAGLPKGVWNVVHGLGEKAGKALTEHSLIKAIAFVGDTTTGSSIMRQGAATLKRVHFELGGKNPVIVFDDADLDRALDAVVFMIYSLNGERCTSGSRLLLQRSIYKNFMEKLTQRVSTIKVGHPLDPATEMGPLIHTGHLSKVMDYVTIGKADGATLRAGGKRMEGFDAGNFFAPTLFDNATATMRIAQEEIFGPFLTVIPFDTEEEALEISNNVQYGLAGYLWTNDLSRAHRFSRDMETGMIWVNSENVRHLPTPFGGFKNSGIGRDGGDYSFDFYMETKNIAIAFGAHTIPKLGI
jgi:5-carboxymethyl-2-hydroxymuconic-semialdehyde dehydrogenase